MYGKSVNKPWKNSSNGPVSSRAIRQVVNCERQNTREIPGFMLRLRVARIPIVNSRGTKRVVHVGSLIHR